MSWIHCAWAAKQKTGSPLRKLVLMMLADQTAHENPVLIARVPHLADQCEASVRAVQYALRDLEAAGIIGVVERFSEGNRCANGYFMMGAEWPEEAAKIAESESRVAGRVSRVKRVLGGATDAPYGAENSSDLVQEIHQGGARDAGQLLPSIIIPKQHQQHPPRAPHAAPKGAVGVEEAYASESQGSFSAGGGLPLGERTWVEAVAESQQKGKADKAAQAKASRDKEVAEIYDYLVTRWPKKAGDQQGAAALTAIKGVVRRGATLERLRRRFLEAVAAWETWDAVPPPNIAKWLSFDAWDQPVRARRPPPPPPTAARRGYLEEGNPPSTTKVTSIRVHNVN